MPAYLIPSKRPVAQLTAESLSNESLFPVFAKTPVTSSGKTTLNFKAMIQERIRQEEEDAVRVEVVNIATMSKEELTDAGYAVLKTLPRVYGAPEAYNERLQAAEAITSEFAVYDEMYFRPIVTQAVDDDASEVSDYESEYEDDE